MSDIMEKIATIELEMSRTQKNKATAAHFGSLKAKLAKLREKMLEEDPVIVTAPHYDKLKKLLDSDLHEALKLMPKPAVHHAHISGCVDIELLIKFTYYNYVYYSAKENKFHVNKNGCKKDGYLAVNALRSYAASA